MTWFTLMTVGALGLALVSLGVTSLLGCLIVWQGRVLHAQMVKLGEFHTLGKEVDRLRADVHNNEEMLDSFRKRDAARASNAKQRRTKEEQEELSALTQPDSIEQQLRSGDDVVKLWELRNRGASN